MAFAKMIDMARTPEEVKEEVAEYSSVPSTATVSKYPYGLCISLDEDTLAKLGLDGDLPAVGEMIPFQAMAKVTNSRSDDREDSNGKTTICKRVELQIVQMGVPGNEADQQVERSEVRRRRFYGASMDSGTAD